MTDAELAAVETIASRAEAIYQTIGLSVAAPSVSAWVTAVHNDITPLRLEDMAVADDVNLFHDVDGIRLNLLRGSFKDGWWPRFAVTQ